MEPTITKCSATMALLDWPGVEMLVVAEEECLQDCLSKLAKLERDLNVTSILMLNLNEVLEIKQREKSDGTKVITVDLRKSPWSTMEQAMEEVVMNRWRLGSSIYHDEFALEVIQAVEEGLLHHELQVFENIKFRGSFSKVVTKS